MSEEPSEMFECTECRFSTLSPADADYHEMDTGHTVEMIEL